jgi:hypothetical protein
MTEPIPRATHTIAIRKRAFIQSSGGTRTREAYAARNYSAVEKTANFMSEAGKNWWSPGGKGPADKKARGVADFVSAVNGNENDRRQEQP